MITAAVIGVGAVGAMGAVGATGAASAFLYYKKKKANKKKKKRMDLALKSGVFGCHLEDLHDHFLVPSGIPILVESCIRMLENSGMKI